MQCVDANVYMTVAEFTYTELTEPAGTIVGRAD